MSSRNESWLSLMNSVSSPASVKSACAAKKLDRPEALVAVARHRRRRDREQRAAQAIADAVDLLLRHDRRHGVERGHHAQRPVILHRQVAVLRPRILPRDHEDRVSAPGQEPDHRVLPAEVEDVVLHDPRRNDQHRLGPDRRRRGRVLDQLDQPVAIDDLARRSPQRCGRSRTARRPPAGRPLTARSQSSTKFCAPRTRFIPDSARVRSSTSGFVSEEVRRRQHVEELPRRERDDVLVLLRHAAHARHRVVPPLLHQQERLVDDVVRRLVPGLAREAAVLRQRHDAGLDAVAPEGPAARVVGEAHRLLRRLLDEPHLLARARRRCAPPSPCRRRSRPSATGRR